MTGSRSGRGARPERAFQNNNGLYDSDCDWKELFKARQYNGTTMCWKMNTIKVRRTDKDTKIFYSEQERTYWIIIKLKHKQGKHLKMFKVCRLHLRKQSQLTINWMQNI